MREIILKIIVEILLQVEKIQKHYKIAEWEVYNEKYRKLERLRND